MFELQELTCKIRYRNIEGRHIYETNFKLYNPKRV